MLSLKVPLHLYFNMPRNPLLLTKAPHAEPFEGLSLR